MLDTFSSLKALSGVAKVSNIPPKFVGCLNFFFFLCPAMSAAGFIVNELETGFRAKYVSGHNKTAPERLAKATTFASACAEAGIEVTLTAIWASGDALIIFPIPNPRPFPPTGEELGVQVLENYELVLNHLGEFSALYHTQPWLNIPGKIRDAEEMRLRSFLPGRASEKLKKDFFRRIWAGFALDGLLIRRGEFGGNNPAILGVEDPSVAIFQNAALPQEQWLPVVQLA